MKKPDIPENESERLLILDEYNILDTLPEKDFDDITRIASHLCQTPISLVTFIDDKRQWFKSHHGLSVTETPRELAFCAHAISKPEEIFVVSNALTDERFANNPLATGEPYVIFYAGVPLVNPEGFPLGTLCVIDNKPKELNQNQIDLLKALANQVINQLELRRKIIQLKQTEAELRRANEELDKFAYIVSHDLKAPLVNISSLSRLLQQKYEGILDSQGIKLLGFLDNSAVKLKDLVQGILEYSRYSQVFTQKKENIDLNKLIDEVINLLSRPGDFEFRYSKSLPSIRTSKVALQQILMNLCSNAIKYNNKEVGIVEIHFHEDAEYYTFQVKDNGPGIPQEYHEKIFKMFQTLGKKDRFSKIGIGIGLATVKKLVEQLGGEIRVESEANTGTTIEFTIKNNVHASSQAIIELK